MTAGLICRTMIRFFSTAILFLSSLYVFGQYNGKIPGDYYLEIGVGTTPINNSRISNATLNAPPVLVYGEFGQYAHPLSLTAGYDFLATYDLGSFELRPSYAFLHLKVNLKRIRFGRNQTTIFGFLGPAFERTKLAVESSNQVLVDQSEVKMGSAFTGGFGAQMEFGALIVGARGMVYRSKRNFLGGGFEEQSYKTGSERLLITIGYKFKQCESSSFKCSTFN